LKEGEIFYTRTATLLRVRKLRNPHCQLNPTTTPPPPYPPRDFLSQRNTVKHFLSTVKMSIIQQVSNATLNDNWRTINIDAIDPESSSNFDTSTLHPAFAPVSQNEIATLGQQVKQLLRGGDPEGALRGALEGAPYGGDAGVKVCLVLLL
jgi:hypothetical protein